MFVDLCTKHIRAKGETPDKKKENISLTTLFYLCFLCTSVGSIVRIFYLLWYPVQVRDAFTYREFIKQWIEIGVFPRISSFPPLGLYLLKLPQSFFEGNIFVGGLTLNMILGLCIICLVMIISSKIYSSAVLTICTGIIAATHPTLVHYSCQMLRENSFLFFSCLSIVFFIDYIKTLRVRNIIASSFFITAACLCRYEATEIFAIFCAVILLNWKENIGKKTRHFFFFIAGCTLSFLAISYMIGIPFDYYYDAIQEEFSLKMMRDNF